MFRKQNAEDAKLFCPHKPKHTNSQKATFSNRRAFSTMTIANKQAPSQQQQQQQQQAPPQQQQAPPQQQQAPPQQQQALAQALGLNLPGMLSGQNPFSFYSQRSPEKRRAHLLSTIEQALEITADCDDCLFSEGENSSSSLFGNTSIGDHDEDDRNSQKQ
jgi:hypothetical protein